METNEINEYRLFWVWIGEYYNHQFSRNQLDMYTQDILDQNIMDLKRAFMAYRKNPVNVYMPRPGQLIEIINPQVSPRSLADEAVGRIFEAIGRIGRTDHERAREHIGELGWRVVEKDGGWAQICSGTRDDNKTANKAQWRDSALATIEMTAKGFQHTPPQIPGPRMQKLSGLLMVEELKKINE